VDDCFPIVDRIAGYWQPGREIVQLPDRVEIMADDRLRATLSIPPETDINIRLEVRGKGDQPRGSLVPRRR
jgi:hypothetical protein